MSELNDWFLSLPEARQAVLRDDKWFLAEAAFAAGKAARAQPAQAGQVLTDAELDALMPPPDIDGSKARSPNAVRLAMRAVEAAVLAKRVPQWLPIETAPKDESVWLGSEIRQQAFVGQWKDYMRHNSPQVTHWMPLPPPPGIVGEKGGAT